MRCLLSGVSSLLSWGFHYNSQGVETIGYNCCVLNDVIPNVGWSWPIEILTSPSNLRKMHSFLLLIFCLILNLAKTTFDCKTSILYNVCMHVYFLMSCAHLWHKSCTHNTATFIYVFHICVQSYIYTLLFLTFASCSVQQLYIFTNKTVLLVTTFNLWKRASLQHIQNIFVCNANTGLEFASCIYYKIYLCP